jgi:hypothetical protein
MLQQSNRERRDGHFFYFSSLFTEAITEIYGDIYMVIYDICCGAGTEQEIAFTVLGWGRATAAG